MNAGPATQVEPAPSTTGPPDFGAHDSAQFPPELGYPAFSHPPAGAAPPPPDQRRAATTAGVAGARPSRKRKTPPAPDTHDPHDPTYDPSADFSPGGVGTEQSLGLSHTGRPLNPGKRAEQNRKAQRAFRERRELHVRELEARSQLLEAALGSADEANRRWEECRQLVDQLRLENTALKSEIAGLRQALGDAAAAFQQQAQQQAGETTNAGSEGPATANGREPSVPKEDNPSPRDTKEES